MSSLSLLQVQTSSRLTPSQRSGCRYECHYISSTRRIKSLPPNLPRGRKMRPCVDRYRYYLHRKSQLSQSSSTQYRVTLWNSLLFASFSPTLTHFSLSDVLNFEFHFIYGCSRSMRTQWLLLSHHRKFVVLFCSVQPHNSPSQTHRYLRTCRWKIEQRLYLLSLERGASSWMKVLKVWRCSSAYRDREMQGMMRTISCR